MRAVSGMVEPIMRVTLGVNMPASITALKVVLEHAGSEVHSGATA